MNSGEININKEILGRCKNGEVKAQFILYKQYSKAMFNIAIRFLNNRMDAEDILQESFVTAFEKLGELSNYNAPEKRPVKNQLSKTLFIRIRNIAAVAIILFSLGYIGNDIINGRISGRNVSLFSINNELGRREMEYKTLISFKTEEVKSFSSSEDVIIKQLFDEIKKLDAVYDQTMKDLKVLGPNERVINTIFNTYEQKIRLLELIILETNKINSHESNSKIIL
jgi:hypothetical protein